MGSWAQLVLDSRVNFAQARNMHYKKNINTKINKLSM